MTFVGWSFANILMPILLPVLGMLVLIPLLGRLPSPPGDLHIMTVVKDGQLCWAVIGMGTAACYDIWEASHAQRAVPEWGGLAQVCLIAMMLPAMVLAACGSVLTTPIRPTPTAPVAKPIRAWLAHYAIFAGSAVLVLAVGTIYAVLHYRLAV